MTISHYRIIKKLGAGGMGEVYLAEDTKLGRKVAIKFLPAESVTDEQSKKRLIREAQAAARLDHPNICAIHETGEDDSRSFIVMQYVEGETLATLIHRKPLDLSESLDIAVQIADALAEAHVRGIVHRDIKPQNVMITARGQVKVLDFGLAKIVLEKSLADSAAETGSLLTEPGILIGTVPYMSPEQVRGEALDARSDIFSFGVVVYEMVSGHQPFMGESAGATVSTILTKEPPPLARYSREVPGELERIVSKALRKDREQRYQTAKDLLIDLKSLRDHLEFEAKLERSRFADLMPGAAITTTPELTMVETAGQPAVQTGDVAATRTTSSAEHFIRKAARTWKGLAVVVVLLAIALAGIAYFTGRGRSIDSIAVLPFVNLGADPYTEYLSDGITESLINALSQLPNLKVISRSSVFRYKAKDVDPQAVGRELKVQAVLTGRVSQRGDGLSISAELMDARDNSHIWGEQYNCKLSDFLAVQEEIANEITRKLQLRLSGEEKKLLTRRYTENMEAYQLYLQGRYYQNERTEEGLKRSLGYFEQAIAKDGEYALAYSGLADSYSYLGNHGFLPPKETSPKAKDAALKALALDETLAEAHTALAYVSMNYDWDWGSADREYRRAIQLNPGSTKAHSLYAWCLSAQGRSEEGLAEMKRALELDPVSLYDNANLGWHLLMARRYDQAIEQLRKTLDMDPNYSEAHLSLGQVYEQKKMYKEAIAEFHEAIRLFRGSAPAKASLGHAYALAGQKDEALRVLNELNELSKQKYVSSYDIAVIYAGLGKRDEALDWLGKAYEQRDGWLAGRLKVDPRLDSLRSAPQFQDLLRRVGHAL